MSTMACRATSYSGGVRIIQKHAEQRPMGGVWKYCMSNVLFGRGSNHFNALCGRGFGEYIVTLVNLRKGCMQQACSTPDTTFVSLPTGGRNLQPTYSVDNAFEGTRQPSTNRHWRLLLRSSPCRRSSLQYRRLLLWIRRGRSRRQRPPTTTPCLPRRRRRRQARRAAPAQAWRRRRRARLVAKPRAAWRRHRRRGRRSPACSSGVAVSSLGSVASSAYASSPS